MVLGVNVPAYDMDFWIGLVPLALVAASGDRFEPQVEPPKAQQHRARTPAGAAGFGPMERTKT